MLKKIPCPDCNGNGFISKFTENSVSGKKCSACDGLGYVEVPMTNADRIRAMSDEELARAFSNGFHCAICAVGDKGEKGVCDLKCDEHCLKWLKQPAKGE